jgi:hypothetical protein
MASLRETLKQLEQQKWAEATTTNPCLL